MVLNLIKMKLKRGQYRDVCYIIEKLDDISILMPNVKQGSQNNWWTNIPEESIKLNKFDENDIPLLIWFVFIQDEDTAVTLCELILEKGYHLDAHDSNSLCAIHYAMALKRKKLTKLFWLTFQFELNNYLDFYGNTFMHYAYATNNKSIIDDTIKVFTKYYSWDEKKDNLKIKNKNDLTIQDIIYFNSLKLRANEEMEFKLKSEASRGSFRSDPTESAHFILKSKVLFK
jgi:ankyrin repeat protein